MLFAAMEKAGTVDDTTKIAKALESLSNFPTVVGKANWTGEARYGISHQIDLPFYIGQVKDGAVVPVASCVAAECR